MIELNNKAKPVLLKQKLPYLKTCTVRLYQNEWTPSGTDVASDYQEADFVGYSGQLLDDFGPPYLNVDNQGETDTCTHQWRQGADTPVNLIYGYYVTDPQGYLVFSERRAGGPVTMDREDAEYTLKIQFLEDTLRS